MHSVIPSLGTSSEPLSIGVARWPGPLYEPADYSDVAGSIAEFAARSIANPTAPGDLSFREVSTDEEWREVGAFRLREYASTVPYMLDTLDSDGRDTLDDRSRVFAAFWNGAVVASIRLSPYPFETVNYLPEERLAAFLGNNWRAEYVEWTRLLVDTSASVQRLMQAMIMFAGVATMITSPYRKYFGYASTKVKRLFSRFGVVADDESFVISNRSPLGYLLLKGDFITSLDIVAEQIHDGRRRAALARP